ncbi:Alpha [Durusdinium trenchii]|uniref:Alpha n=1 Tax=Durusdinium trenchii TaxID=1381693 RepID=A0ABP0MKW9_9DINO
MWPLLHWMTPYARFKRTWAEAYKRVNEQFADKILEVATSTDLIWIHDYHLFLVPQMLRKKRDNSLVQEEAAKMGLVQRPGHLPAPLHDTHEVRTVKRPEGLPCTLEEGQEQEEEEEEGEGEEEDGVGALERAGNSEHFDFQEALTGTPRGGREAFGTALDAQTTSEDEGKDVAEVKCSTVRGVWVS